MEPSERDRMRGALVGLAICDAVGTTVEFIPPGSFEPLVDMVGGGPFHLLPGQWTDDTSMALCIAESLIECQGYNSLDVVKRFYQWYESGHLSSNGLCFDIGKTTITALMRYFKSNFTQPYLASTSDKASGNGCLMRLCPVPLAFSRNLRTAVELSGDSGRITHGGKPAVDCSRYFGGLLVNCLKGISKEELFSPTFVQDLNSWTPDKLSEPVEAVAMGSFKTKEPPEIKASGYSVQALEAALWAFWHTDNFKDGCLKCVNLGDDADTVGAIYGQIAGCFYGYDNIPPEWREKCYFTSLLTLMADEIHDLSLKITPPPIPIVDDDCGWMKDIVPVDKVSERYDNLKRKGYDFLELENKEIHRRSQPCPKQYKSLEEFDSDVKELSDKYMSLPQPVQDLAILKDFQRMWAEYRERCSKRISRPL